MANKLLTTAVLAIFLWLLVGTLVYWFANNCSEASYCSANDLLTTEDCGWNIQESFYYAVQAGLSIGFGLLPESNDISRLYTIIHILLGSSIIGGALAFFLGMALTKNGNKKELCEKLINDFRVKLTNEGWNAFTVSELRPVMINFPKYYRECLEMVETDEDAVVQLLEKFKIMGRRQRRQPVNEVLKRVIPEAEEFKDGAATLPDLEAIIKKETGFPARCKIFYKRHREFVWMMCTFILWILLGTLFGLFAEEWTVIQSVYFAVSSLSTGGLQSVTRTKDGLHVLFTGIYCLIGVPLYGMTLGTFANVLIDRYTENQFEEGLSKDLDKRDVAFVQHLCQEDLKASINLAEYTEVQLLMLGQTDRDTLSKIRDQFQRLDKDGNGRLDRAEYMRRHRRAMARYQADEQKGETGNVNI